MVAAMWTDGAQSRNRKTGPIPTLWVGKTRQESMESCHGCPLLTSRNCYAQFGTPAIGHASMIAAARRGKCYSLKTALEGARRSVRSVRMSAIGDPAALGLRYLRKASRIIRGEGLQVLGYTHHWKRGPFQKLFMASTGSLTEADEACDAGYRATAVVPWDFDETTTKTPKGRAAIVCPAIRSEITCDNCRLCDPLTPGPVIMFPDHGPQVQHLRRAKGIGKPKTRPIRQAIDI